MLGFVQKYSPSVEGDIRVVVSEVVLDTRSLLSESSECGLNTSDCISGSPQYSPLRYSAPS